MRFVLRFFGFLFSIGAIFFLIGAVGLAYGYWTFSKDLPDPEAAFDLPDGFAGIARDLSVPTLVAAYSRGLYPHSHVLAPKWHSPPERERIESRSAQMRPSAVALM